MRRIVLMIGVVCLSASAHAGSDLSVLSIAPARHVTNAPADSTIVITFDRAVMPASAAAHIHVYGVHHAAPAGTFSFQGGNSIIRFKPDQPFAAGEIVTVIVDNQLTAADRSTMRSQGYAHQFWVATRPCGLSYAQGQTNTVVDRESPRPYGGSPCDFDGDSFIDLAIINEDTSDIRVLMNLGDGSGTFAPFLTPSTPTGGVPSPNRTADFNGDGRPDICTANTSTANISVLLGNGDGSFQTRTDYPVGASPRGLATLDADGDGDLDIVCSNYSSNNMSLLLNNGNGTFAAAVTFDSGLNGEYGLDAGDMNNDGICDLIVGTQSGTIRVLQGNGNGTFTPLTSFPAGGLVWMIAIADLNGDGNLDVSTANGSSSTGSIMLGNGAGGLSTPSVHSSVGHAVATDVADMDGDGDIDWVLSSFGAGIWRLFTNNGAGVMSLNQTFNAVNNPACAVLFDVDNDRDLDLALIDEIADIITIYTNECPILAGDLNLDGGVNESDRALLCSALGSSEGESNYVAQADLNDDNVINEIDQQLFSEILPPCAGDVVSNATFLPPGDGGVDGADLAFVLAAWGSGSSCADMVSSATFVPPPDGEVDGADLGYLLFNWGVCK